VSGGLALIATYLTDMYLWPESILQPSDMRPVIFTSGVENRGKNPFIVGPTRCVTFQDLSTSIYLTPPKGIEPTQACFAWPLTLCATGVKFTKVVIAPECNVRLFPCLGHLFRCVFVRVLCPFGSLTLMLTTSAAVGVFPPLFCSQALYIHSDQLVRYSHGLHADLSGVNLYP